MSPSPACCCIESHSDFDAFRSVHWCQVSPRRCLLCEILTLFGALVHHRLVMKAFGIVITAELLYVVFALVPVPQWRLLLFEKHTLGALVHHRFW